MNRSGRFDGKSGLQKSVLGQSASGGPAATGPSAVAASCGIAFMAKASTPGRAKTRLVPPLTFDEAAALNTVFLQDISDNLLRAGEEAAIAGYAAFAPK